MTGGVVTKGCVGIGKLHKQVCRVDDRGAMQTRKGKIHREN